MPKHRSAFAAPAAKAFSFTGARPRGNVHPTMRRFFHTAVALAFALRLCAQFQIESYDGAGGFAFSGAFTNGVCTLEQAGEVTGPWWSATNIYTTGTATQLNLGTTGSIAFFRAVAADLSNGREGFTNLVQSYNLLTTVAGAGGDTADVNKWQDAFEGGPATDALLSRPHIAMADAAGNIFIADKSAHAVRKVTPDGLLHTVAGTNGPGNAPDSSSPATEVGLAEPNGLWVKPDGTTYILDLANGKVRKLDTNGMLSTLFTVPGGISAGRGLWVNENETVAFVSSSNIVKRWTATNNVTDYASGLVELGNLIVDPWGHLVVTDRRGHRVWRCFDDGSKTNIAGNGTTTTVNPGGGDGGLATLTPLREVRGVWFLPTGAYFVCTHRGSQLWYVDVNGLIHLFLNGSTSDAHAGDGTWFWNPGEFRISECRAVTMDYAGNLLICEHDSGYIRKVQFLRHGP